MGKGVALAGQRLAKALQAGQQRIVAEQQAQADRGGIGVVGGLRHVHVVVRVQVLVFTLGVAHGLKTEVGDHLVGIHVGRSTGTALDHVHHELLVELATNQARTALADGHVLGLGQVAQLAIGIRRRLLDHRQGDDQLRVVRQRHAGQAEVVQCAQGLDAVIGLGGNGEGAKQVFSIRDDATSDMMVTWLG